MEELTQHVPSLYIDSIACHCKVKGLVIQRASDIIVVCTSKGVVIEFSDQKILKTCEIDNCKAENIQIFVCYKPFCVYYYVTSMTDVYFVAREENLRVSHVFSGVKKIIKDDFWKVGSPQIGLWYCNKTLTEEPHFVTDLSLSQNEKPTSCDRFALLYYERLQETKTKCAQLKQNLDSKRNLRCSCTQRLMMNQLEEDLCDQLVKNNLVSVIGEKDIGEQKRKTVSLRLQLLKVWQKVHNDKWIIGVQIVNRGESPIVNVKMFLKFKDGKNLTCKTHFYTRKTCDAENDSEMPRTLITQWQSHDVLHRDVLGTCVAVLNLSSCWPENFFAVGGIITYRMEKETSQQEHQLPFPDVEISLEEFVKGLLSPFRIVSEACEEDFLSVLVSSHSIQLLTSEPIVDILTGKFGFSSLSQYGSYYSCTKSLPYLAGILVESWHVKGHDYHLAIYAKDSSQVLALVQCLYSAMPHNAYISPAFHEKSPNLEKMYKSLEAEINFAAAQLTEWEEKIDLTDGKIHVPRKEYLQFRSSLFNLEKETDELDVHSPCSDDTNYKTIEK